MTDTPASAMSQVDRNYQAFRERLPELMATHPGKVVVLRDGEIVEFFDSVADAVRYGESKFGRIGEFSVQEVTNSIPTLGFYSSAINNLH